MLPVPLVLDAHGLIKSQDGKRDKRLTGLARFTRIIFKRRTLNMRRESRKAAKGAAEAKLRGEGRYQVKLG